MKELTAEQIVEEITPFAKAAGLTVFSIVIEAREPPMEELPIADILVNFDGLSAEEVYSRMMIMERSMAKAYGESIRTGYYSAEIGYDDIPADKALIQIDILPFALAASLESSPKL